MKLIVEVGHAGYSVEQDETGSRESMAAAACARIKHCFLTAGWEPDRFFDVRFPDHEVITFISVDLGHVQKVPADFDRHLSIVELAIDV